MLGLILLVQALTVAVSGPPSSPEYLPLHVAAAEGHFGAEGVEVTLRHVRSETAAAEALARGRVDLAATSLEAALRAPFKDATQAPRLVFALTAAPPVALLSGLPTFRSVADLAGTRVGLGAPGAPEAAWFGALLSRARLKPTQVDAVSLGDRGVAGALAAGEVSAALVPEPFARRLLDEHAAHLLADLRDPEATARALGTRTVNAGIFVRPDRPPDERAVAAVVRALLAAERLLLSAPAEPLAVRLPVSVVGRRDEFRDTLEAARRLYVSDGRVDAHAVRSTLEILGARSPFPPRVPVTRPASLLDLRPLERALGARE